MKLSETLRRCAGHYIVDNQMADEAEALEARLQAYECLQRSSQAKIEELEAELQKEDAGNALPVPRVLV